MWWGLAAGGATRWNVVGGARQGVARTNGELAESNRGGNRHEASDLQHCGPSSRIPEGAEHVVSHGNIICL